MKVLERLTSNPRRAMVQCDQCSAISEAVYYTHNKNPDSLCQKCTLTNRNQSDTQRASQSAKVDEEVKLKNKKSNGLFILKFTETRKRCLVRCNNCQKEYERLYKPNIYNQCGCYTCARDVAAANTRKHSSVRYDSRLYAIFNSMMRRTGQFSEPEQDWEYKSKGTTICKEWLDDRTTFFDWALANGYKDDLTIDRIDNDGNYEPSNCRWTTKSVQSRNTRVLRSTNTSGYRGVSKTQDKTRFRTRIRVGGPDIHLFTSNSAKECAYYYDKYVRDNQLEHTKNFSDEEFNQLKEAINLLA